VGNENDPWVKTSDGRIMRQSEFLKIQDEQIKAYQGQMTVAIEELGGLSDALYGQSGDVWSALYQLQSDMAGIDHAIGTDDNAQKVRQSWNQAYPQLQAIIEAAAKSVAAIAGGLSTAADQVLAAEEATLSGFGRHAVDPRYRPQPRPHGRMLE
jgi:hypothetical protein